MLSANDFKKKQVIFLMTNIGDKLSFSNDNVIVKDKEGKIKFQSTCYRLFMLCVVGNISITSGLIQRSKKFGFSICLMSTTFKVYDVIGARMEGNTLLRKHQYQYDSNDIGRLIEQNKIKNQAQVLKNIRKKTEYQKEAIELLIPRSIWKLWVLKEMLREFISQEYLIMYSGMEESQELKAIM